MAKTKDEQPQQTMEDFLLSQLDMPAIAKNKESGKMEEVKAADGHVMSKAELIATTILNNAMKGDLKSAQYIQNIQMRAQLNKKK